MADFLLVIRRPSAWNLHCGWRFTTREGERIGFSDFSLRATKRQTSILSVRRDLILSDPSHIASQGSCKSVS
ncbi:hypothetical protein CPY51_06375 [Rhizobium tubonense]|uniref:Uncharacterized protein n=1 Tax=Rhizobium tubonense TaxID=484088 RepID=A0A2W4CZB1_9HYPH|nr:hypothetical protein CPY51_06375 [Rhizobium tubonense]